MFYHLKIIVRNVQCDRFHSVVNIGGLSIGMAAAILLLAWVYNRYFFGEGDRQMKFQTLHTDPSFLTVFSFPLLQGDANTALNDLYSYIRGIKRVPSNLA